MDTNKEYPIPKTEELVWEIQKSSQRDDDCSPIVELCGYLQTKMTLYVDQQPIATVSLDDYQIRADSMGYHAYGKTVDEALYNVIASYSSKELW